MMVGPLVPQQKADTVYVSFAAEIVPQTAETLLQACANISNQKAKVIYLLLSSPGGVVSLGIHVYNVLRALPCKIITHNVGSVNSIANVIFLAGEERYACPGTTFMFHGVGFDGGGKMRLEERDLLDRLESVRADQSRIAGIIKAHTQFPDDGEVEKLFLNAATKDTDFAQSNGIIHGVRDAKVPEGAPVAQLVFQRQGIGIKP